MQTLAFPCVLFSLYSESGFAEARKKFIQLFYKRLHN